MKKTIFFCAIFLINILVCNVNAAEYELVMDADSGRVLYSKNMDKEKLIASTTKIMTTLVVLRNANLSDTVTVGKEVLDAYGSAIYIKPEEKLTVEDLLYGLMLRSGNDAAIVLANYVGGSIEGFAELMNESAKSIGMYNTNFTNPHGLDDDTKNTSTVYDMALLMREAMKNDIFKKITSTKKYTLKTNFNTYEWFNKNKLLTEYKYATGGKIGYTDTARHTFVSSASKDNKNLIIASFVDGNKFNNHKNLYEKYFEKYKNYKLIDKNNLQIKYKNGYKVFTTESFSMLLSEDEKEEVRREVTLYNNVNVEESATIVGTMSITMNEKVYKKLNIYAIKPQIRELNFWDKIKGLFKW